MKKTEEEQEKIDRLLAEENMMKRNQANNDEDDNEYVIWPKYVFDEYYNMDIEPEEDKPDSSVFFEVGFDVERPKTKDERKRHYRMYFNKPLENVKAITGDTKVFIHEHIYKAKIAGSGMFGGGSSSPKDSVAVETGKFKGLIQVYNDSRKERRTEKIDKLFIEFK
jgi:hypothetical protein